MKSFEMEFNGDMVQNGMEWDYSRTLTLTLVLAVELNVDKLITSLKLSSSSK